MYEDAEEMIRVVNNYFQSVFPRKSDFQCQTSMEMNYGVQEIQMSVEEVRKIMEEQV